MSKLYELSASYLAVLDAMDEADNPEELADTLACIEGAIEEKAHNLVILDKTMEADEEAIAREIKRLTARKKAVANRRDSIKGYLKANMEAAGIDKIKTALFSIRVQVNPPALAIENPDLIPSAYQTVVPEHYEINNAALKADLMKGIIVPGATLTRGTSLRIG